MLVGIADDADQMIWSKLDTAFSAAKVPVLLRGTHGDNACLQNSLARGCI